MTSGSPATLSAIKGHEPTSPETEVKARVLSWCSAWSSIDGVFQKDKLADILTDGPVRMAADFGDQIAVSITRDAYLAFWSPLLSRTFSDWSLMIDSPIEVTAGHGMASAQFHARIQGTTHAGERKSQRQHTRQVLEHHNGAWRLTQEQIKVSPDQACF